MKAERENLRRFAKPLLHLTLAAGVIAGAIGIGRNEVAADNPSSPATIIHSSPFGDWTEIIPAPTPTPELQKPLPPRFIEKANTGRPEIAFTLDGGAGSEYTPAILDILKEKEVKATMLLSGVWMENNPDLVRRIIDEGHQIFNHSWDHLTLFTELSDDQIRWQLRRTEEEAQKFGITTKPYFRPPFGDYSNRVIRICAEEGFTQFLFWTYDSGDWIDHLPTGQVLARTVRNASPGAIVVMHLNSWQEPQVLATSIDAIRDKGLTLVTLPDLMKD